jgi:hypothetical protein
MDSWICPVQATIASKGLFFASPEFRLSCRGRDRWTETPLWNRSADEWREDQRISSRQIGGKMESATEDSSLDMIGNSQTFSLVQE